MSTTLDLLNDCSAIIACLPQLRVIDVLEILHIHSSEQQHQRIRLTLQDIFNNQDKRDSITAQQNDIALVQKLLPDIAMNRVAALMSSVGSEENRKAVVLRLLLHDYGINIKASKHKFTEDIVSTSGSTEDQSKKRKVTNKGLSGDSTNYLKAIKEIDCLFSNFDSYNNNIVTGSTCIDNKTNTLLDNNSDDDKSNMDGAGFCIDSDLDASIFQPSTSRAVWNPCTGKYEDRPREENADSNKIINTIDIPMTNLKSAEETRGIVGVDWSEDFPSTTQQEVAKTVNTPTLCVDVENEKMKVEVDNRANDDTVQSAIVSNKNVEEEYGTVSHSATGGTGCSKSITQSRTYMEDMEVASAMNRNGLEVDNRLLYPLMEMFPQACPNYLRNLCANVPFSEDNLNELSIKLLSDDYPHRGRPATPEEKLDPDEQFEILKQVLPDADPTFLRFQCEQLADNPDALKEFISDALENKNYPTMKEYLRKQQLSAQQKQYTTEFKVSKFLEVIPDPVTYFEDPQRQVRIPHNDIHFVHAFLRNEFCTVPINTIKHSMKDGLSLMKIYSHLECMVKRKSVQLLKTKRKRVSLPDNCQNIPLLQEMAYITHKQEILEYMKELKKDEALKRQLAKENGLLRTCNCCFDDEILERDIVKCENGCSFCKQCIQKSVEVAFGNGKLEFPCLTDCQSHFSLQALQSAVTPKLFSKLAQKKQMEEVKAAGIEDLEMCPFCDFATIPAENDKLFRCLNPECMKESCRQCKEPSHIPLKCNEVEKDEDVKRRTYIENKMSEALLRKCNSCGKPFIKSDGCNKITCTCGARQCYVCGKSVTGYEHFNGQGGDKYHLCPLYSDTESLHEEAVLKGAEAAKAEIGVDTKELKIDPTADIRNHYSEMKRKQQPLPPGVGLLRQNVNFDPIGVLLHNRPIVAGLNQHHHHYHHHHGLYRPPRRYRQHPIQPNHDPNRH